MLLGADGVSVCIEQAVSKQARARAREETYKFKCNILNIGVLLFSVLYRQPLNSYFFLFLLFDFCAEHGLTFTYDEQISHKMKQRISKKKTVEQIIIFIFLLDVYAFSILHFFPSRTHVVHSIQRRHEEVFGKMGRGGFLLH